MITAMGLVREAAAKLNAAGIEGAMLDAEILMAECLGRRREDFLLERAPEVDAAIAAKFTGLVERRLAREPVARILGRKEFWSLDFILNEATLVPRPESETLVETAIRLLGPPEQQGAALSLLDLGTGSGCLLLALLSELPAARGLGTDCSQRALEAAGLNADRLGLSERARFALADWHQAANWQPPEAPFDLIVANPPYIASEEIEALAPEVREYDPRPALDGGGDGLGPYGPVIELAAAQLAGGGWLVLELGVGQEAAIGDLMRVVGFQHVALVNDLAGIARVIYGKKP